MLCYVPSYHVFVFRATSPSRRSPSAQSPYSLLRRTIMQENSCETAQTSRLARHFPDLVVRVVNPPLC